MAIAATSVWRIRPGGNDANGAGYDSGIASAGTDFSQQDAAQLSLTDIACSNTTTVTSVTGGFTAAMIGNAIRITGGGATSGYYFIITRVDTNTITVDRTPGTVAAGTGKVGGAATTYKRLLDSANAVGDKVVAGNAVYIRGGGTNTPSSSDYPDVTGFIVPVGGSSDTIMVQVLGENGRPRFRSNGLMFHQANYVIFRNLYLSATSNSNGTLGIANAAHGAFRDCTIDTNNQAALVGLSSYGASPLSILNCEIKSGTTTPSFSAGARAIYSTGFGLVVSGCYIHHSRDASIYLDQSTYGCDISNNIIAGGADKGIYVLGGGDYSNHIENNTIDGNSSDGIKIDATDPLSNAIIRNNIISNNGGYGINVNAGTTAANDAVKGIIDFNDLFNNTSGGYHNISAGANDLTLDPQFTNASGADYSIGTNLKAKGWPPGGTTPVATTSSTYSYVDIGAAQRQEAGGAAGMLYHTGGG